MNITRNRKSIVVFFATMIFLMNAYSQTTQVSQKNKNSYPPGVEPVLKQSGKNRPELENAINYFKKSGDTLKLKAIYFLVSNMDIHYSSNYYWADSLNRKVPFNELSYSTFEASLKAFGELKKKTPGIHPVPVKYKDIDSIKSDFLINNVEQAFEAWKLPWAKHIPFEIFCEYILPYRISVEPLQDWRNTYKQKYAPILAKDHATNIASVCNSIKSDIMDWFTNTFPIEARKEPLPRLGPEQLLFRKQGPCEDIAGLAVYAMRSQGIPATEDIADFWATSSGSHFWNLYYNNSLKPIPIDITSHDTSAYQLAREPAKVLRLTYSKQLSTLANQIPSDNIPDCLLRTKNYLDVTEDYWPVKDITCQLSAPKNPKKVAYCCVLNYLTWVSAWWGPVKDNKVTFRKMAQGAVYLPMYYGNSKLFPAGNPVAIPYKGEPFEVMADTVNRHTIVLAEQDKYLIYRPGKHYRLFYWKNNWKLLGEKTATATTRELVFESVPNNALYLMVPDYSQGKERPFTINEKGAREWW